MRVLIVNTSEKAGGAAVAANRLMDALNNNGVKAKMLVREMCIRDRLYTGCPTGCGPVKIDDHLEGYLEDRKVLDFMCK